MANKINVKLILELRNAKISRNIIASTRHMSRNSVSDAFHIADNLGIAYQDICTLDEESVYRMFEYFKGSTLRIVCDNLKTGVISHPKEGVIILTDAYEAFGSHYLTAIMPARVRKPKDKPSVEGTVGKIATAIIARLRNETFYSFATLKRAVYEKNYYSCPYQYIGKTADLRVADSSVEIYIKGQRVSTHNRFPEYMNNKYSTHTEDMPDRFNQPEWDDIRITRWAYAIGSSTGEVIDRIFASVKVKEQGYNPSLSVLRLSPKPIRRIAWKQPVKWL